MKKNYTYASEINVIFELRIYVRDGKMFKLPINVFGASISNFIPEKALVLGYPSCYRPQPANVNNTALSITSVDTLLYKDIF